MGYKIGIVGGGLFAPGFTKLFKLHPYVDEVYLAELIPERRAKFAEAHGIEKTFESLEDMLKNSDVDAVAIFTQRHLHGPQTLQALRAGKHVYCAVPIAQTEEEIFEILEEVKRTGLIYMSGETSYYYPGTVLCRDRFRAGLMGDFVYGEAQYLHDMMHGFYDAYKYSGGEDWKKVAGIPPMHYPTHTMSMVLSVTGATATQVSCLGYKDRHMDGIFTEEGNLWGNTFSNETALVRTSDGGMLRANEFRRVGWGGARSVYMSMFGTTGSYEEHPNHAVWSNLKQFHHEDVTDLVTYRFGIKPEDADETTPKALIRDFNSACADVHHMYRLPESFDGQHNGHEGSHQFLVDDFMKALATNKLPPNNAWRAAAYMLPGIVAHKSALRNGETLNVPQVGEPPKEWELLDPDSFVAYRY